MEKLTFTQTAPYGIIKRKHQQRKVISEIKSMTKLLKYLGLALYSFVILATAALLLVNQSVDVRPLILPVIIALYVSALGFSYAIASKNQNNKVVILLGTALLAVMFAGLAFFAIAGVAWFVGVAHVSR